MVVGLVVCVTSRGAMVVLRGVLGHFLALLIACAARQFAVVAHQCGGGPNPCNKLGTPGESLGDSTLGHRSPHWGRHWSRPVA
jgi:hypothetical protein